MVRATGNTTNGKAKGPASYFPSIEAKYCRAIAEWQALVRERKPSKHMELVSLLKEEHAMGQGHANARRRYVGRKVA